MKTPCISMCNMTALVGGFKLSLRRITALFHARWNPNKIPTATIKVSHPTKCCILVFSTGKVICTGAGSERSALCAMNHFLDVLQTVYPTARMLNKSIELMTASASMGFPVDLQRFYRDERMYATLDDLFPALRWYVDIDKETGELKRPSTQTNGNKDNRIAILIFDNGNLVLSGSKSRHQISTIWKDLRVRLLRYRCSIKDMREYQAARTRKRSTLKKKRKRADEGEIAVLPPPTPDLEDP